jgi:DNA-binding NtrC family response regulator
MPELRLKFAFRQESPERAGAACLVRVRLPGVAAPSEPILVVDDEPSLRQLMRRILSLHGYAALDAADGESALARLEGVRAVILDLSLPPDGGEALLERMLETHPDLCVVMISGLAPAPALRARLKRLGGIFLPKPFAPSALIEALETALRREGKG